MPTLPLSQLVPGVRPDPHERMVFWVNSDRPGVAPYRVDMTAYHGNGACDCPNFTKGGKARKLAAGALPSPGLECKHIARARRWISFVPINHTINETEKYAHHHPKAQTAQGPLDHHGQPAGTYQPPAGRAARQAAKKA